MRTPRSASSTTNTACLSAILRTIGLLLGESRRRGTLPDFTMLRAMLFYVDEFPERLHHTKESQLLFPRIRERSGSEFAAVWVDATTTTRAASNRFASC